MKPKNSIRYDLLTRECLRGVIRKAMKQVQLHGLPGAHHFYLTFRTTAKGVIISPWLQEKYPDQMTIVLQHQFSELKVTETTLSIRLHFNHVPETLNIPFSAILAFYDPSVEFALQFDKVLEDDPSMYAQTTADYAAESSMSPDEYDRVSTHAEVLSSQEDLQDGEKVICLDAFRQRGSA